MPNLKKLRRAEGGAKIVEVFRVKNHDFRPKNHIFSKKTHPNASHRDSMEFVCKPVLDRTYRTIFQEFIQN
jgi:hypothetical protein